MSRQHSKGKKRPRAWHHGKAQGKINDRALRKVEPVFARSEADRDAAAQRARAFERDAADWADVLAQLSRSAPFVPRLAS